MKVRVKSHSRGNKEKQGAIAGITFGNFIKLKGKKKEKEMEDIVKNFQEITDRRDSVRKKIKETNFAIKTARNAEAAKRTSKTQVEGVEREEVRNPDKQFRQITGVLPTKVSQDFLPSRMGRQHETAHKDMFKS